ncbi:GAF domain-containing protein [Actinomycetospora rhizophila]|uniref:GAF domain-containing protein n=1 Tax=Actinomycetospora rhizophila TaxID=1416876 RepID=A0ABV9Z7F2_9PSEU
MGVDREHELGLLRARLRARIESSRSMVGRARTRSETQDRDATEARARAREHLGRMITDWIAVNGLATEPVERDYEDVLHLVLDATRAVYPGCSSISVTTVDQLEGEVDPYTTVLGTGVSPAVDDLQYRLHEGPTVDALELDMVIPVRADDLAGPEDAERWPRLCRAIGDLGIRSALSIAVPWSALRNGLRADRRALGAINLYAPEPHAFAEPEMRAMMLGSWAGAVVTGHRPTEVFHGDA